MLETDPLAKEEVIRRFALAPCLHFPVAARNKASIEKYIGVIKCELSRRNTHNAFLVSVPTSCERDVRLPIWKLERSAMIDQELQVWVHVNYNYYRPAYKRAFPDESIEHMVLGHVLNRNVARMKFFEYVRVLPIARSVNSSSAFSEKWAMEYHGAAEMQKRHRESVKNIQYADLSDITMMLNIHPGGGVMNAVNEAQYLVDIPAEHL